MEWSVAEWNFPAPAQSFLPLANKNKTLSDYRIRRCKRMVTIAMYTTIKTLWEQGHNKCEISRLTGHDWKTVSKIIAQLKNGQEIPIKKPHPRLLDPYKENILEWIEEGLSGIRIREKILEMGQSVGYSAIKSYVALLKKRHNIFMRIHTKPGEEAQVDFGYAGYTLDNQGKRRKTWVFNMKLSYSRYDYYEKVYDQKVETFILCHINSFNYFGGVPECVKIDNLKAAILQANFYEPVFQKMYKSFAEHYGFKPLPCRVYQPNDKGKVESGIKYVKNNFFAGRKFKNEQDLDRQLKQWLDRTCNVRIHGTTKKVPKEVFVSEEKNKLLPLPNQPFNLSKVGTRKVYHDCHIYVGHNYYSVPFEYVGKEVEIQISNELLRICCENQEIAVHTLLKGRGEFSTTIAHYPKYKRISETEYQKKYQSKMASIGPFAEQVFFVLVKNCKQSWTRPVQGILSLSKKHEPTVINLSCKRALAYDACSYQTIKNICQNGAYQLPVEFQEESLYEYHQN